MIGITAYGAYIPALRLQKRAIADANSWFDPGLNALAKGERSMCNWDEDAITLAVEAGRDCLHGRDRKEVCSLIMASTSAPFLERQNSVVVAEALSLSANMRTMDVSSSQRAGTSALLATADLIAAGGIGSGLVVASEHRRSKCGSRQEMVYGDGAVAIELGSKDIIAEYVATHSTAVDFVDRYRSDGFDFDVDAEQRWVRDEGYLKLIPQAIEALLAKSGIKAGDVQHFILSAENPRTSHIAAERMGFQPEAVADSLISVCGITGVADPLLLLARCLETAQPDEKIVVVGFGQGCDVLLLQVTNQIRNFRPKLGVSGTLAQRRPESNYNKFVSFNNLVDRDMGKRSEVDKITYVSALYRNRKLLNSFMGGKCSACGTVQIPRSNYCVNPECKAFDTQVEYCLAESRGRVVTWTADALTFDLSPPAYFGLVEFEEHARLMVDFTEVDPLTFDNNVPVTMHFRIRQVDDRRGFRRYFWKAKQVQ